MQGLVRDNGTDDSNAILAQKPPSKLAPGLGRKAQG